MAQSAGRPGPVAPDILDGAAVKGRWQSRTGAHLLGHRARSGRSVQGSAARRRVEAALAGMLAFHDLTDEEGAVVNAEISAAIDEKVAAVDFGNILAARRVTTVGLGADGQVVSRRPCGTAGGPAAR